MRIGLTLSGAAASHAVNATELLGSLEYLDQDNHYVAAATIVASGLDPNLV